MANPIYQALKRTEKLLKKPRMLLIVLLLLTLIFIIASQFRSIFFSVLLVLLGSVSMIYQRYFKYAHYIGFELCMMATVLSSLAYGPVQGAVVGGASIFFAFVLSGNFKPNYFISVLALPAIAFIVPLFSEWSLPYLGILMTIIYDAIILPLYVLIGGSRIYSSAIFFVTHVLLNAWVFSSIAPILHAIMV